MYRADRHVTSSTGIGSAVLSISHGRIHCLSYRLPVEASIAAVAIEICDGMPSYVEEHLDKFVDNVGQCCPWGVKLVEVSDFRWWHCMDHFLR